MFWEDIEPVMTDRLEAAIAQAYRVFSPYRRTGLIAHCDCPVCMTHETARELSTLPLQELGADLLAEYTNSAHGYDFDQIEQEFKFFLPRYFDLIGHCDMPSAIGGETCLYRLGNANYRNRWPEDEVAAVNEFFAAFLEASINQLLLLEWPAGYSLEFDLGEVLGMIVIAGGDLDAVLKILDEADDPEAATHMAALRSDVRPQGTGFVYHNHHLIQDHKEAAAKIGNFVMRASVSDRIVNAIDLLADPHYDRVLDEGLAMMPRAN